MAVEEDVVLVVDEVFMGDTVSGTVEVVICDVDMVMVEIFPGDVVLFVDGMVVVEVALAIVELLVDEEVTFEGILLEDAVTVMKLVLVGVALG